MALLINTLYNVDAIFLLVNTSTVLWRDDPPQRRTLFCGTVLLPLDVCHLRPRAVELPRQAFPLRLHPCQLVNQPADTMTMTMTTAICNRAGELDRTTRSPTSTTQQSTSERGVGGWNGRWMTWWHCFWKGILVGC